MTGMSANGAASTTTLHATRSGKSEVPKGDPDGKGNATIRITGNKVCYTFAYSKIDAPSASACRPLPSALGP